MIFFTLLGKEMLGLRKNIGAVIILFIVPIFLILVMGFAFEDKKNTYDIGIVNSDGNQPVSMALVNGLKSVDALKVSMFDTEEKAQINLNKGEILGFLVIPYGFDGAHENGDAKLRLIIDDSKPVSVSVIEGITKGFIEKFNSRVMSVMTVVNVGEQIAPKYKPHELVDMAKEYVVSLKKDPITLDVVSKKSNGSSQVMADFNQTTCGMTAMFILFLCILWGSLSILEERLTGTLTRLRVSPASFITIFGSKLVYIGSMAFVQFIIFFSIGHFVLQVPVGNVFLLIFTVILFILQAAAMGLLISLISKTRISALGLSFLVIMILSPLGGLWFPLEIIPAVLQKTAAFLPTGAFMIAVDKIINKNAAVTDIVPQLTVMMVYLSMMAVLSIRSGWRNKMCTA